MPARKYFFSSTKKRKIVDDGKKSDGHVSVKNYLMCKKIWDKFDIKDMEDYHNHYLKKDVLLLVGVFEKFIDTCLKFYRLDPCHYFSSPGLSWDAMLKMTGLKLGKILTDIDKYSFIEKGLRGGILYIAIRYAKANNKYIMIMTLKNHQHLYMNNLYGWAMTEYLSYGRFKWLKNVDGFDVMLISEKSPIGYFLEVDLEYPDELHELHNYYPLAPEKTCCF